MEKTNPTENLILGIDPGTNLMGYGLVLTNGQRLKLIQYGVIHLHKYNNHELKLKKIFDRVLSLIDDYHPDEMALEAPFYGKNVQSMLKLGRAQGVAMAAALSREISITEYAPKKVKSSVTGNGNASKEQVAEMLKTLLNTPIETKALDATDAVAVAICHHFQKGIPQSGVKSWNSFIQANPKRVK